MCGSVLQYIKDIRMNSTKYTLFKKHIQNYEDVLLKIIISGKMRFY